MDNKLSQILFSPAVALLNRMGYTKKFTLLWLISLVAIAIVMYGLFVSLNRIVQPSQREMEGIALIEPVSRVMQLVQQHRGIAAVLLGGNVAIKDRCTSKEREAAEAFHAMERALPPELVSGGDFQLLKADWERLRKMGARWSVEENFTAHTNLIERLQALISLITDSYALTLDIELSTYYLIDTSTNWLPHMLEHLGQLRAYGTVVLSNREISESQKIKLHNLIAALDSTLNELQLNIRKAGRYNQTVEKPLLEAYAGIASSAHKIAGLVATDILSGRFTISPDAFLDVSTAEIDRGYAQMHDTLLPTIRNQIEIRIANARNTLLVSVGGALLLFLLVVYISASLYYAVIGSIQLLVRSAHAFAEGNLGTRVSLNTCDELSLIGDSFNKMAEGFNALLEERKQAELALAESRERLFTIIETALDAVVQIDANGAIIGWNAQAEKIFGWSREEAIGRYIHETIIPPQYRNAHVNGLGHFLATGEGGLLNSQVELLGLRQDGQEFPIEIAVVPIRIAGKYEFSAFIRDITSRKNSENLIWRQANFDELTGLPNRHMFYDRLAQEIKKVTRYGVTMTLLYIDLDHFKEINDTLGHSMGDMLLKEAARRISAQVRDTDTVARLGGDEFIIILANSHEVSRIDELTQKILHDLAEPFQLGSETAYLSASIGITVYPHDAADMEELVKNADQAMYAAKNAGRNRFSYFTHSMQEAAQAKLRLANDLRLALAEGHLTVSYQPIVEMATSRLCKAEALIRWQHPVRGSISPAEFIPLAEETGLIIEIGNWVFREAAIQAKLWRTLYDQEFQVSVNMSPIQFRSAENPCESWLDCLRELELPGQSIVIEITEGLLLEAESGVTTKLLQFRNADIHMSLDDFGTGYSSLSYLQKFDIDYLKIDQSFIRNLTPGSSNAALSEAIIMMAHRLGIKVIAEGVETEAQRKLLASMGCNYAQGYLFSKPVPAVEFEKLLKR